MTITRIRKKLVFFTGVLIACSFIVTYILWPSSQLIKIKSQQLSEAARDFDIYKMKVVHIGPARNDDQHLKTKPARGNAIIVSHGRSGSSLMGDIFNHHPSVFYMYEPLQTAERVMRKSSTNTSYSSLVKQFLTDVFRCRFNHP